MLVNIHFQKWSKVKVTNNENSIVKIDKESGSEIKS